MLLDTIASAAPSATEGAATGTGVDSLFQMMPIFMIVIGLLALYSAFTGKGLAIKNDYPKVMKADAVQMMRKLFWIVGPVAIVSGVLDYMGYHWAYWVGLAIMGPAIIIFMILFRRKFKQYLKK